ncbi:MAG: hypothetical protein NTY30_02935 [Candidatus Berkelbacteria bacterium]|nr:hypothetical protein [Candidatus Berkelbacteria bacterium]
MRNIEFGEITWTLINIIARVPKALLGSFLNSKSLDNNLNGNEFLADKLIDHLKNLKRSGYIELNKKTDGSYDIKLTTKGKIKDLETSRDDREDGKIRIISYDIPETMASKRRQFCRSIRRIGFKKMQKSLWICKLIKADEIDLIIDELKLRDYIAYFVCSKSNAEPHINKLLSN